MINIYFYSWLVGIPIVYYTFINIFEKNNLYQNKTVNNNKEDAIVSHILTSLVCVIYLSLSGILLFKDYKNLILDSNYFVDKNENVINHLITPMILYQGWNTVITLLNKDLYSLIYVIHHIFVIFAGLIGLTNYAQYILIVYFGLLEISNIFLSIVEYARYEKYIVNNKILYNINNLLFAISFYVVRIFLFQYYNYGLINLIFSKKDILFENQYIVQTIMSLITTLLLSFMQFFWGYKIYKKIIRTINKKNE